MAEFVVAQHREREREREAGSGAVLITLGKLENNLEKS